MQQGAHQEAIPNVKQGNVTMEAEDIEEEDG